VKVLRSVVLGLGLLLVVSPTTPCPFAHAQSGAVAFAKPKALSSTAYMLVLKQRINDLVLACYYRITEYTKVHFQVSGHRPKF
jgi:hypothetical protein